MFVYQLPKRDKRDPNYVFIAESPNQITETINYYINNRRANIKPPLITEISQVEGDIIINASPFAYISEKRSRVNLVSGVKLVYTEEHLPLLKNEVSKAGLRGGLYKIMACPPDNYFVSRSIYNAILSHLNVIPQSEEEGKTIFIRKSN